MADSPTFNSATEQLISSLTTADRPDLRARAARRQYTFVAHTTELQYPGITDAAGNPINDTVKPPGLATKDFVINFDVQPQPVYITSMALESTYSNNGSTVIGTEQSYFELPSTTTGTNTRDNVVAPPTAVVIDFSSPLPYSSNGVADQLRQRHPVDRIGQRRWPAIRR